MGHSKSIFCHRMQNLTKDADNDKSSGSGNGKLNHYVEAPRLVESSYSLATEHKPEDRRRLCQASFTV